MPDAMDVIQWHEEEARQRHISRALSRPSAVSRVRCVRCDARIPPARRRAVQGVQYCVTCQETIERKHRHDSRRKA
ncbi:TraR/DksA C4-type zinc finger protein [Candidatus Symbiopectobacterium sp.]|uniref:TraR/DksA C4-type zinc finger protein n=1 Tax=Candidatus Symbiopectobacterium sp. TaxID=2816440 RepID=UPI0025C30DA4|nr:TraR/DksA C4-type zinc finger protein [Candidatus Symbiopectobacterium sp.]